MIRSHACTSVTLNDELVTVESLAKERDVDLEKMKNGKITLGLNVSRFGSDDMEPDDLREIVRRYLSPYFDYEVKEIEMSTRVYLPKSKMYLPFIDKALEVERQFYLWHTSITRAFEGKTLGYVWNKLNMVETTDNGTMFDMINRIFIMEPKDLVPDGRSPHTMVFGCGNSDCNATLYMTNNPKGYQQFVDHFEHNDIEVRATLCCTITQIEQTYVKTIREPKEVTKEVCFN